jgi:protein gp37
MSQSKIEWLKGSDGSLGCTWNPIQDTFKGKSGRGYHCEKCSPGCDNCYAEAFNRRFGNGLPFDGHAVRFEIVYKEMIKPYQWKKPRRIFVQSMGDLFMSDVRDDLLIQIIEVIQDNPQHTFMTLTKRILRAERFLNYLVRIRDIVPLRNLWIGVSVCVKAELPKIEALKRIKLPIRFVSFEPLLEDMGPDLDLTGIQGVFVGGETGIRARPMHPKWVQNIFITNPTIPFFFKSWGNWAPFQFADQYPKNVYRFDDSQEMFKVGKKKSGREFLGREWNQMPE